MECARTQANSLGILTVSPCPPVAATVRHMGSIHSRLHCLYCCKSYLAAPAWNSNMHVYHTQEYIHHQYIPESVLYIIYIPNYGKHVLIAMSIRPKEMVSMVTVHTYQYSIISLHVYIVSMTVLPIMYNLYTI